MNIQRLAQPTHASSPTPGLSFARACSNARLLLILAATTIVLSGCSKPDTPSTLNVENTGNGLWTGASPDAVRFDREQIFGADGEDLESLLGWPIAVTTDGPGNVYVVDMQASKIVAYEPDGSFRWASGGPGTGPGEIENPGSMVADANALYLTNLSGTRIDKFTMDGDYIDSRLTSAWGRERGILIGFASPTRPIVIGQLGDVVGAEVVVYDTAADSVALRLRADVPELAHAVSPNLMQDVKWSGDRITTGHLSAYAHSYYTVEGHLERVVTRKMPIVGPSITEASIRNYSSVSAPYRLADGLWLAITSFPTNLVDVAEYERMERAARPRLEYLTDIAIFDDAGQLLWSRQYEGGAAPPFGRIMHADGNGSLYAVASGHVERWRVDVTGSPD